MSKIRRIELTNEKGNVSAGVRAELKTQIEKQLLARFVGEGLERTENTKKLVLEIGVDHRTDKPIYARFDVTVTMDDQDVKKEKKAKSDKEKTDAPAVPNLFGDDKEEEEENEEETE